MQFFVVFTIRGTRNRALLGALKDTYLHGLPSAPRGATFVSFVALPPAPAPSEAASIVPSVAAELGIEALSVDVSSACSTFAAQLDYLNRAAADALPEFVLIVQPENNTRAVDFSDRRAAVIWGDASAAAIVSAKHAARASVRPISSSPSSRRMLSAGISLVSEQ